MSTFRRFFTLLSISCFALSLPLSAQAWFTTESAEPNKHIILNADLLIPLETDRDIHTINLSASHYLAGIDHWPVYFYGGVTATYSRGDSTQVKDFDDGSFADITATDNAWGFGPQVLGRIRLMNHKALTVYLDGTANIIMYNKRFPNNGEYFNFLFRAGPVLEYRLSGERYFGIGFNFAHVSNGQGEVPENPSYDAIGVTLNFLNFF